MKNGFRRIVLHCIVILVTSVMSSGLGISAESHFWTVDRSGEALDKTVWVFEGVAGRVFPENSDEAGTVPVYRWYSPGESAHFWTTDIAGELLNKTSWHLEGVAFRAFPNQAPNTIPLYRWVSSEGHFWTTDPNGESLPQPQWRREGPAAWIYSDTDISGTVQLNRWHVDPQPASGVLRSHEKTRMQDGWWMETSAQLGRDNALVSDTHISSRRLLSGFAGAVQVNCLDASGKIIYSSPFRSYGVNGRYIPGADSRNERNIDNCPFDNTRSIYIIHRLSKGPPIEEQLNNARRIGMTISEWIGIIAAVVGI